MSETFSVSEIRFDGHGIDKNQTVWVRFWLGGPGSPSVVCPVSDLNADPSKLWRRFGELGIHLRQADKKSVLEKIGPYRPGGRRFGVTHSIGWSTGYVTPSKVFGAPPCIVERDFGDLDVRKYRSAGTLEQWQADILPLCAGNSRLIFALACAFAGPLLKILGEGSFGFQLSGPSSIGKTIIMIVAGSVWGCRIGASAHLGFAESWATTLEGVERYARAANDALLLLDETRAAGTGRKIGELVATFIMRLAEGVTKNRLITNGAGDWRTVYLGSSNPSLIQMFAAADLNFDDAYRVRFPDIPADAGRGFGAFEHIHGFGSAAEFANELRRRATTSFGAASEYYLKRLARDEHRRRASVVKWLNRRIAEYHDLIPAGSAADGRITKSFAIVYAAGLLARHYGILPWAPKQIGWAVRRCELAHRRFAAGARVALDPIAAVRTYIADNRPRFRSVPDPNITAAELPTIPGFIYTDRTGATEYLISQPVFTRQFAHLGQRRVLRALDDAGFLIRMGNKHVSKAPIRSSDATGRRYVYRFRGAILTGRT